MIDDYVPPVDPVAAEIHKRFCLKMAPGGEIDKILNGNQPIEKRQPLPDAEIDGMKRNIDAQMAEYAVAIDKAVAWINGWKAMRPRGFRAKRRKSLGT